jgi:hypothetical protein
MTRMQVAPAQLFYDFCLDDHIPAAHFLRRIDGFLDLESVRTALKPSTARLLDRPTFGRS